MNHTCSVCKKEPGTVRVAQTTGERSADLWLCQDCCEAYGIQRRALSAGVGDLLSGIIDRVAPQSGTEGRTRCPTCLTSIATVRQTGCVGCADCYTAFAPQIRQLLGQASGGAYHTGKWPARLAKFKRAFVDRRRLQEDLEHALETEEYERAAEIRDSLQSIDRDTDADNAFSP